MTHLIKTSVLILGLSAFSSLAIASPEHNAADTNNDGMISYAEFSLKRGQSFEAIDSDSNGQLSKAERKAHHKLRREIRSEKREGKMAERAGKHFSRIDTNGDGSISRGEHDAGAQMRHEKMNARQENRTNRRHEMKGKHNADTNKDGFIDRAEFDGKTRTIFAQMDTDANGFITADERTKARKHRKLKRFGHGQ